MPLDLSTISCPGYSLDIDTETVCDQDGNVVSDKDGIAAITIDGVTHHFNVAKLAWCALHNVSPFEVSDEYIFFFQGNLQKRPVRKGVLNLSTTKNKKQMDYKKSLKAWAESQGFLSSEKYVLEMHNFIKQHNISLKDKDNYAVINLKDNKVQQQDGDNNDQPKTAVILPLNVYTDIKTHAKENQITVEEYIEKRHGLMYLPEDISEQLKIEIILALDEDDKYPSQFFNDLYTQAKENQKVIDGLKAQVQLLQEENKTLQENVCKYRNDYIKAKDLQSEWQTLIPYPWYLKRIEIAYMDNTSEEIMAMSIINDNNNAVIDDIEPGGKSKITIDDFTALLKDAKQRLLSANGHPDAVPYAAVPQQPNNPDNPNPDFEEDDNPTQNSQQGTDVPCPSD